MIVGHVRDNLPRVLLTLPGLAGPVRTEFVVDTGFDGGLALPPALLARLDIAEDKLRPIVMADGSRRVAMHYRLSLDWFDEEREVEVIELQGRPLIGGLLLEGCQISIDMRDGGEVVIESS